MDLVKVGIVADILSAHVIGKFAPLALGIAPRFVVLAQIDEQPGLFVGEWNKGQCSDLSHILTICKNVG